VLAVRLTRNTDKSYDLLKGFIKDAPLDYAVQLLNWIRVNTEKEASDGDEFVPLISIAELDTIGAALAQRIKSYGSSHYLQVDFPQDVAYMMWIWNKWGNPADIKSYFENSFKKSSERAIEFIMTYVPDAWEMETGKKTRSDFRREAYDSIAAIVEPDIFVAPLIKLYGKRVNEGEYSSSRFGSSETYEFQIAQQFLCIHRSVTDEKKSKEQHEILEGEVVATPDKDKK